MGKIELQLALSFMLASCSSGPVRPSVPIDVAPLAPNYTETQIPPTVGTYISQEDIAATPVQATREANIRTLEADVQGQMELWSQLEPNARDYIVSMDLGHGGCTGIVVQKEPVLKSDGSVAGYILYIDSSSHCVLTGDFTDIKPPTGRNIKLASLTQHIGYDIKVVKYINSITFGNAAHDQKHTLFAVYADGESLKDIQAIGMEKLRAYNQAEPKDCFVVGVPDDGFGKTFFKGTPIISRFKPNNSNFYNGLVYGEGIGVNGGGSGGPHLCKSEGYVTFQGEVQDKLKLDPYGAAISTFTHEDVAMFYDGINNLRNDVVQYLGSLNN